ncbi:threonine transporter RhtB [Bradyrhizobium lablabi]|uniref:Threonine transporter RhtB n=1 Tax=Bradyrhizobium lablabi TaxID=722472 RepID=A0A0R3MGE3_9BRAD|nr:LysE family translocator [Bradyrhizobium lablabi]KRR16419.1 threonine transporter RhtB [Bradyrhizobium lablabi]
MTFLPAPEILAAFTAACLLLILTPGPDMTFFLGQTLAAGRARGMAAMLGACLGVVVHSMLAAFGLSALLVASATAFTVIKIAGAVYLVWLGIQAIRHGSALTLKKGDGRKAPISQVFLMGVGINLLNPKVVMFFLTFLPQFVSVSDPHAGSKLMFLGLYSIAFSIPICAAMIMMANRFTDAMRRSPRAMRIFDWLFAGLMGTFALRLLLARGN